MKQESAEFDDSITVVVTCYREGLLLQRALASLARQSDQVFETLIVNDASPCADTNTICQQAQASGNARLIRQKRNRGLSAARNAGFKHAAGGIVAFLDGDDELPDDAIYWIRETFRTNPEADFVFGNYVRHDVEDHCETPVDCNPLCDPAGWLDPKALLDCWTLSGHTACRKRVWRGIGGYRQQYSYGYQDCDFWMRALYAGFRGRYVPQSLYIWHRSRFGMNESRVGRKRYYLAKSLKYYEVLARRPEIWEKTVRGFLEQRDLPDVRQQGRAVCLNLLPSRLSRWPLYLKFLLLVCAPYSVSRRLASLPPRRIESDLT